MAIEKCSNKFFDWLTDVKAQVGKEGDQMEQFQSFQFNEWENQDWTIDSWIGK